jgi:Mu-like prophage major head subunit gpT
MPALTPSFLMDLETRMQIITEREYERLNANLWWQQVAKMRPSTGLRDIILWLLSTAQIADQGKGGNMRFEDIVSRYTTVENKFSGAGLKLSRAQLEDTDGGGVDLAAQWSADIGAYMSYWPQKQTAYFLKNAHTASLFSSYDEVAYFSGSHPYNPFNTGAGTFANLLTGAASGTFPGACPIDDATDLDDALVNLGKVFAYICSLKMPNGEDPRMLRPKWIFCSPRMFPRVVQLTSAKFLAQVAGSGAGSADVEAVIKALGFAQPIQCDELAGFESDTTYFVACETLAASQLGAVMYVQREPYRINYYGTADQAQLNRSQELEWHCLGRNVIAPGHPFLLFKVKAS